MNARIAAEVIAACGRLGVRTFCVCAGSRNHDLLLQLLRGPWQGEMLPFFEERSAAFFALGRCLAGGRPAAVLTTSGTAAAELLPAAIEAHYLGLPLVLVTADRPLRFRGTGAPQAIEQSHLFGPYADYRGDVTKPGDAEWACQGWMGRHPLHLNVSLEEPSGETVQTGQLAMSLRPPDTEPAPFTREDLASFRRFLRLPGPCLVALGQCRGMDGFAGIRFLDRIGAPILAEATSGLRGHPDLEHLLIKGGELVLRDLPIRKVLRLGGVPSGRWWRDLEKSGVEVFSLAPSGFPGLARPSECLACEPAAVAAAVDPVRQEVPAGWEIRDIMATHWLSGLLKRFPGSEPSMLHQLSQVIDGPGTLFLGNSLPLREWNLAAKREQAERLRCFALRGANGIDGALSTFLGLCENGQENWGVFGDLTALYDLAAPWALRHARRDLRVRFVVLNNGGGGIFRHLPSLRGLSEAEKDLFYGGHYLSFEPWARMWNLGYRLVTGERAEEEILGLPESSWKSDEARDEIIEIRPDPGQTQEFWDGMRDPRAAGLESE